MNTDEDNNAKVSITDETVMCEMDVELTPISQISETRVTELNTVPSTSISTSLESKSDSTASLMQLLLNKFDEQSVKFDNLDKKLDEQKSDSNIKFTKLNDKFDSFDITFNELRNEIKNGNDNHIKQCDKVIKKLDENLIQLENRR